MALAASFAEASNDQKTRAFDGDRAFTKVLTKYGRRTIWM
jgi:hypothetical protein